MLGAAMGLVVAGLAFGFSTAPGWRDARWFTFVGIGAGSYTGVNSLATMDVPSSYITGTSPWLAATAIAYCFGLQFYTARRLNREFSKYDKVLAFTNVVTAAASLIPGAAFTSEVFHDNVEWLGLRYSIARTTQFGDFALLLVLINSATTLIYFARAWKRGANDLRSHSIGVGIMTFAMFVDVLTSSGLVNLPYLSDIGLIVFVTLVGADFMTRFVASATSLEQLKTDLEQRVEDRTIQLAEANERLMRAEKLAALGQLSAGVAHEINRPAGALARNLTSIEASLNEPVASADVTVSVRESLENVARITRIVRQLLDAGRSAAEASPSTMVCNVEQACASSIRMALDATERNLDVQLRVPSELQVVGEQHVLEQVFTNIVVNAVHAIPVDRADATVFVSATAGSQRVSVRITDNGVGMSEELQRRIFEPYFSTKAPGAGTGLGLPVSLGLLHAVDGTLAFESELGKGTTAIIEFQRAPDGTPVVAEDTTPTPA